MNSTEKQELFFQDFTNVLKNHNVFLSLENFGIGHYRDDKIVFNFITEEGEMEIPKLVLQDYVDGESYL